MMNAKVTGSCCLLAGLGSLVLVGCGSTTGSTTASSAPSDPSKCLIGSWTVSPSQFAMAADDVLSAKTKGSATGEVGIGFTDGQMTTTFNVAYTSKAGSTDPQATEQLTVDLRGGSTAAYVANPSTLSLSGGRSGIAVTATSVKNGVTTQISKVTPYNPLVNFYSGTLAYTCASTSLYLSNQDGMVLTATRKN